MKLQFCGFNLKNIIIYLCVSATDPHPKRALTQFENWRLLPTPNSSTVNSTVIEQ